MNPAIRAYLIVLFTLISAGWLAAKSAPKSKGPPNLELQVAALTALQELDLTADQLKQLEKIAEEIEPGKAPAAPPMSNDYRSAMSALRDALVADDDEKISDAQDKVDGIRDKEKLDPDHDVDPSESARKQSAAAIGILSSSQLAGFIAIHSEDVPDPVETLVDAVVQSHDKPDEYAAIKAEAVDQVSLLLAGFDKAAQQPIAQRAAEWIEQAHKAASSAEPDRTELESSARQIVGSPDPFLVLHHWMEREIAGLLANPELREALAERLKHPPAE